MIGDRWLLVDRLKRAVKKIKLVLNFSHLNQWKLLSSFIGASSPTKRLSFNINDENPSSLGLRAAYASDSDSNDGSSSARIARMTSYRRKEEEEDDVDKRADAFIANFYKQLQYERQISLELRYCRNVSFDE